MWFQLFIRVQRHDADLFLNILWLTICFSKKFTKSPTVKLHKFLLKLNTWCKKWRILSPPKPPPRYCYSNMYHMNKECHNKMNDQLSKCLCPKRYLGNSISSKSTYLIWGACLIYNVYFLVLFSIILWKHKCSLFQLKTSKLYEPRINIFFRNIASISILAEKLISLKIFPSET